MKQPLSNSFSAKLVALVLGCVILPLLILGTYSALKLQASNENDFRSALRSLATQNAQEVDRWLAERTRRVEELSSNSVINDGLLNLAGRDPQSDAFFLVQYRLTKYLEVLKSSIPAAIYIGLYDASGRFRIAADSPAARMLPPLTDDERRALADGAVTLSEPFLQKLDPVFYDIPDTDKVPAMRFSAPVSQGGELLGFVSVMIDLNSMSESILFYNERIASVGFNSLDIYMVDANGVFLTASAFQDSLRSIGRIAHNGALELDLKVPGTQNYTQAFNDIRARFAEGRDLPLHNMTPYPDYRAIPVVGAWSPLEAKDWYVIAEIDGAEFEVPVRQAVSNLVLVVSVILVCVSLLVWVFTRRLLQPLQVLRDAAQGFAAGDRRVRCNIERADEIGLLAASFDQMIDAVDSSLNDLQEQVEERQLAEEGMRQARNRAEENARSLAAAKEEAELANQSKSHLLDNLPTQIIMADTDLRITYVNPAMQAGLEKIREALQVPPGGILDARIDELHAELAYVGRFRTRPDGLPHSTQAAIGGEVVDLLVSASFDQDGAYLGPMLTWDFVTEQVRLGEEKRRATERERAQARELQEKVDGMLEVVQAAGAGDLTRKVDIGGQDAIGQMGEGLQLFLRQLRQSIGEIGASTRILADASKELTESSRQMEANAGTTSDQAETVSTNARTVSDSLQVVASAVEQTAASIDGILDNANRAATMAQRAVAMAAGTNETIGQLGENSKEIGGVVKLIMSIAEQTNLLALNATIEAARAGESGKGFAVVANEVKELARETAEATGIVGDRIAAIQANTTKATAAISEVSAIIGQIDALQANIAGSVQEQHATSGEIAANITRAADSGVNISQSIEGVAQAAQTALTRVGETRNAADRLTKLSADLEALVQKFAVDAPAERPALDRLRDRLDARASA